VAKCVHNNNNKKKKNPLYSFVDKPLRYASHHNSWHAGQRWLTGTGTQANYNQQQLGLAWA